MKMVIVYVRGGDKTAPKIAEASGMEYGTRHDYTPYAPVYMLDIHWDKYDWKDYLAKVKTYQPTMALAPDYYYSWQWTNLNRQISDLRDLQVPHIMVCPKFVGAVKHIPLDCLIAVSVPTSYAGFLPDYSHLIGRKVHLLGGRVDIQGDLIRKLKGLDVEIVSVDGSHHAMKAAHGQFLVGGSWYQVRGGKVSSFDLCLASAKQVSKYLRMVYDTQTQERLFA
jgi:hypothetical protein